MKRGQRRNVFTSGDISGALADHDAGAKVPEICRRLGIAESTFYAWRARRDAGSESGSPPASTHPDSDRSIP